MLVFVRTKTATIEVAEKLEARGYRASALNGDIAQKNRERLVAQLKSGKLDVLVATDVAARGLDVDRISHVINYDIPHDTEAYVHRIGRTGRAGREGDAILFVAPRERRMLKAIENATHKEIELMELPSTDIVNNRRIEKFKQSISDTIASEDLDLFKGLIEQYRSENNVDAIEVAAALAKQLQGSAPFLLSGKAVNAPAFDRDHNDSGERPRRGGRSRDSAGDDRAPRRRSDKKIMPLEAGMDRYRIDVGFDHKVKPANIVGAIANEADIDSKYIGRIEIFPDHSLIDLPEGMPKELLNQLKNVRVVGQRMNISFLARKKNPGKKKTDVKPRSAMPKARHRDKKNKGKPKRAKRQG